MSDDPRRTDLPEDDSALAAEYVLGVLDAAERATVQQRIARDKDFARLVAEWEQHFAALNDGFAEEAPPPQVASRIGRQLFTDDDSQPARSPGLWASAAFWRVMTAAALACVVFIAAVLWQPTPTGEPPGTLVANLSSEETAERFVVVYEGATMRLRALHVAGKPVENMDFELWLIADKADPVSVGVIGGEAATPLPEGVGEPVDGTVFAVTLEPLGGSPIEGPTGPVVAEGTAKKI